MNDFAKKTTIPLAADPEPLTAVHHTFRINGEGGQGACTAVQSVLQEHGLCGYTEWTSPKWHFLYLTYLEPHAILHLLGDLGKRFRIGVRNGRRII